MSQEKQTTENQPKRTGKRAKKREKKKKSGMLSTIFLLFLFLVGLVVLLYPTVSDWWNARVTTQAIASYQEAVANVTSEEQLAILEAAREYNQRVARRGIRFALSDQEQEDYRSQLDITGTGIMGYINIPVISVSLPVYHGTAESVLQIAVGHLEGTSLPVGGESTHAALSGHRGLPSARLFTDLDRMREGDIFTITIFSEVVTYQVDQIRIVLPTEVDDLAIEYGEDYCTLITCTPYGVNSHRMLVRGRRIENIRGDIVVTADAIKMPTYYVIFGVGIPLLFVMLVILLIFSGPTGPGKSYHDIVQELARKDDE